MWRLRKAFHLLQVPLFLQWLLIVPSTQDPSGYPVPRLQTQADFVFTERQYNGTILERAHGKTYILSPVRMGIHRADPGLDVEYKIDRGDKTNIFKAEAECILDFCFLRVRTRTDASGELNREHKDRFDLRIRAEGKYITGPRFIAYTKVHITVLDENDLSPLFYPEEYEVPVSENITLHTSIVKVTASDADIGINGEIYYSFLKPTNIFAIHPTTGVVSLTRPLNYTLEQVHKLVIVANDRGPPTTGSSTASLVVNVQPVNYSPPKIVVQKLPRVTEHGAVGTIYAILTVTDSDIGDNGVIGPVQIVDGNTGNVFTVMKSRQGENVYNIIVNARLDREETPDGYNLTVSARDNGNPSLSSEIEVQVLIQDTNDNEPQFDQDEYNVDVIEVVPVNTPVVKVRAGDEDSGRNGEVEYSIIEGNEAQLFKINRDSGLISTDAVLDAEKILKVVLKVKAEDQANTGSRKIGTTTVNINIQDFNDNAPIFDQNELFSSVRENLRTGTSVLRVTATDADSGENGRISYSIINSEPVPFEIDHFTGTIKTTESLDYEVMRMVYMLRVRGSDWGTPHRQETEVVVTVKLENVNDNEPEFEKVNCRGHLSRSAPEKTEIVILPAIDFDVGDIITYRIIDGNENNCFDIIPSTGGISLGHCNLFAIQNTTIKLSVVATDGVHYSTPAVVSLNLVNNKIDFRSGLDKVRIQCDDTDITKRLQDLIKTSNENNRDDRYKTPVQHDLANVYAPQFSSSVPKYFEISENAPLGSVVLNMTARDQDNNAWYNSKILYVISAGNSDGAFKIDTFTGSVMIMSKLDRESVTEYKLQVTSTDMGTPAHSAQQLLRLVITDENDNPPLFEHDHYETSVYEHVSVNSTVIQVYATDKDKGLNSRIQYSLLSDTEDFYIDPSSGIIKVRRSLDRERQAVYHLGIMVKDSGLNVQLSSTTKATIKLQDANDNEPVFVPQHYNVKIREDLPIGTVVMIITATDPDEGDNGKVTYKLVDGMDDKFQIDEQTGTIRIMNTLDYETKQVYNISAKAEDWGRSKLVSTCLVNVEVVDVDENRYPPAFEYFVTKDYVYENQPVGTFVMHVSASDSIGPKEKSRPIYYSIRDGSGLGRFSINSNGTLHTSQVLDRETATHYWLTIYAQDGGLVPKFARLEVLIEILDDNDNVPLSKQPLYDASVVENSGRGERVAQIEAEDADLSEERNITYTITGGDPQNFFQINRVTGVVQTTGRSLNRERQDEYVLEITISDNDYRSPLSSTTRVIVRVLDENDERPRFTDKYPDIRILEQQHESSDIPVYRIVARDADKGENATLTYTIKWVHGNNPKQFRVDPRTGTVYSTEDLIRGQNYELQVKAVDGGNPARKASVKLSIRVLPRPTSSPNPPTFSKTQYTFSVAENEPVGQLVEMMSGDDKDGDRIWYSIQGGNEANKFAIQPEHGTLYLAENLDWEQQSDYNLTICATDGVHSTCVPVHVYVKDINEFEPEFSQDEYVAEVSESAAVGIEVARVKATDRDQDKRLYYSLSSAQSLASLQKFSINLNTGVISLKESLDHEALSQHMLTVMVKDLGTPSRKSFCRVKITVLDHNDHPPRFLSHTFKGRVYETSAVGTSVLQIIATDRDKGENAEITYSLISGNVGGAFTVDPKLGIVAVAKELNRGVQSHYKLVVMATDHGPTPLSSTAQVSILVTLSDNSPPKFKTMEYTAELAENEPAGSVVVRVDATSRSSVVYDISRGNHFSIFMINPNSGVISANVPVDFEEHRHFNLTVTATNIIGATSACNVIIHVLDKNDNRPVFNKTVYYGHIKENAAIGSMVYSEDGVPLVVRATDKDSGSKSLLQYEVTSKSIRAFFHIDPSTGAIKTRSSLDHETTSKYNFTVQVSDLGQPGLMAEHPARVIITVEDVNDSPPRFTNHTYVAKVLLPTYKDVVVLHLEAYDPDTISTMPLSFSIVSGNRGSHFDIDKESGELFVRDETDMEQKYGLTVQVSDGKYDTTASVVINIEETVDTGLHFSKAVYTASVLEQQAVVEELTTVMAIGHRLNEALEFSLLNNRVMFAIKKTSGVVETRGRPFDRELVSNYTLVVEVKDSRGRLAHGVVVVTVTDINDNPPVFVGMPYNSVVAVDAPEDEIVRKVEAFDIDSDANSEVRYSIIDGSEGKFNINLITGEITVEKLVPTDKNRVFYLKIEAQDMGRRPQRSEATVPIHVVDRNSPLFEQPVYNVSVNENVVMHTAIANIQAISPQDHKLIYSISRGDQYGDFAVHFDTGLLSVVGAMDYEETRVYELTMRATDTLTGTFSEALLFVNLVDVNDNAPKFLSESYTEAVSEGVSIGTNILKVKALDKDTGMNSVVHYAIAPITMGHPDVDRFQIDSQTGIIITKKRLDYEEQAHFYFQVIAIDGGMPSMNSTAVAHIIVMDLNDNAPKFSKAYYECTITDQAKRGQLVTKVMAFDDDHASSDTLFHSIVDGNDKQTFSIDPTSGLITVSEQRKPQFQSSYTLNISVSDGVFTSYTQVTISVRNTNQHTPMFDKSDYHVEFSEITGKGMSVLTVTATDEDRGTNGLITYSIPSDRLKEVFHIDADSGEITTETELDREKQSQYVIPVAATDNGGRMRFATVHVTVDDYNDCIPHFLLSNYQGNIFSNASVGQHILQVKAVDEDADVNSQVVYTIYQSGNTNINNLFSLDSKTGVISVKGDLSQSVNQVFPFFVGVQNEQDISMQNRAAVDIFVTDPSDKPPSFEKEEYAFFIKEDTPVPTVIATIKAWSNQPVKYSIVPGSTKMNNNPMMFDINSKGQLTVKEELDREDVSSYLLTVKVETQTSPPLVAYTQVNVQLRDVNDNDPVFDSNPYVASVIENASPDTEILQLHAYDKDQPAVFTFKFGEGMENIANTFSLDAHTGWLRLLAPLDREVQDEYVISVVVYDNTDIHSDKRHSSTGTIILTVTDFNDNPPVFQHDHFNTAVNEGAAIATVLGKVVATDKDIGDNSKVSYYITSGDPLGQFEVYSTGEVFVNRPLDRETKDHYDLTIAATDGGFVTYISVALTILDDNDHSPECDKALYTKFVSEDVAVNTNIEHVHATDADEANTRHSKISYYISGSGADSFTINKESGILRTKKALDREELSEYRLVALAVDGGKRSCSANVLITVTDINDNKPEFAMKTRTFHVLENAQINTLLARVTARDIDSGINHRITYELQGSHMNIFRIDAVSGIISVMKSLDREEQSHYNITVAAYNPGSPSFSSTIDLQVLVGDENDNPPKFERTRYYASIREDTALKSRVLEVLATSQDIGQNAHILYSITGGNEQGKFSIDPVHGTIRVAEPLDHELSKTYFLTVTATDKGDNPLSSTTVLVVNVTDVNDNPPQFGQSAYSTNIKEDAPEGMEVIRVLATDVDSAPNAEIKYRIVRGNTDNKFVIGQEDGVIRVKTLLDRETVDQYALIVEAQDSGLHMARSAVTVVSVYVLDVNDNPPRFDQANYTARVQEGRRTGIKILEFTVVDIDLEENGPPFDFDIVSGNSGREFHVSNTGILSTAGKLNKELKDTYVLTIRVFDSGQPIKYADTEVTVYIIDESMHPPVVRNLSITITSYKDRFPGGIIGKVDYKDDDPYDTVNFQVVSNNRYLFDVDREDGNVIAMLGLDAGHYEVNISVSDGKFTSYSQVTVNVVSISEEMVASAITIQFANMIPEQFFANSKKDFQATLKHELGVSARNIEIINVQAAAPTSPGDARRRKREASNNLDVLFAVRKSGDRFFNKNALRKKVTRAINRIEDGVGVEVVKVFSDMCDEVSCTEGMCIGKVVFDNDKLTPVIVGGESYVSARHYYSYQCECRGRECAPQICGGVACPSYKLCEQDDFGNSECVCPDGKTGEYCSEEPVECKPTDVHCQKGNRPMTFMGRSYAKWTLAIPTDRRLTLSMWIRTRQLNANLMNSKGIADYSILEIVNGKLQYKFDCGSGEGLVSIPVSVSDGKWHKIHIDRNGRVAELELDQNYRAMSTAPGINDILNLNNNDIYFGAEVAWHNNYQSVSRGFEGCMKDVQVFDVPLLFSGENKITHGQHFEKIEFNCKEDPWRYPDPNVCSSSPCMHDGTCVYNGLNSYICHCKPRYIGSKCEVDTNPCADSPCLNQGQCQKDDEIPNAFSCKCRGKYQGKRCEYGHYCIPNPCGNGGTCIEGPTSHLCQCLPSFQGSGCERLSDRCETNPCQHGGRCEPRHDGMYFCNCTADRTGPHCEEVALPVITGGIKSVEIYGIAGVGVGIILIVLIFVMCRLWRRKKQGRRRNDITSGIARDDEIQYMGMKEHEMKRKLSSSDVMAIHTYAPQPPPVPTRPASYTPSTHDSLNTLNNFDTVRNYGSAADELETTGIHNIPTFQEYLETFQSSHRSSPIIPSSLPPPPRSNPPSDTDSIQKPLWEFEYPNILENYPHDKKSSSKSMPGVTAPLSRGGLQQQHDASSFSSLAVSESEEDLNGYHWDTSDWAPRPSLPNISEVPAKEVLDSPNSSNDSNIHISNIEPDPGVLTDDPTDYIEDSEYVGDSEYAEEFEIDDLPPCYADHPNYQQILELRDLDDTYELPQSLQVSHHPNNYLPNYSFSAPADDQSCPDPLTDEDNSNISDDNDNDSVIHYNYSNAGQERRPLVSGYVTGSDYNTDHERSVIDDMSVSAGGYTSTNGSCSDVSAYLCEIDDSEINPSDDSEVEDQSSQRLLAAHFHTRV